jgi:putative endonuclease
MLSRTAKQLLGDAGEAVAAALLERHGLRIVERNYRVKGGEIDLVARDGASVVFVEVRRRAGGQAYGGAAASVTRSKQRRLIFAARHWLQAHGDAPCRFDVVLIDGDHVEWIRAAFAAD